MDALKNNNVLLIPPYVNTFLLQMKNKTIVISKIYFCIVFTYKLARLGDTNTTGGIISKTIIALSIVFLCSTLFMFLFLVSASVGFLELQTIFSRDL